MSAQPEPLEKQPQPQDITDPESRNKVISLLEYKKAKEADEKQVKLWIRRRLLLRTLAEHDVEVQAVLFKFCSSRTPFTFQHPDICPTPIEYENGCFFFFDWFLWTYNPRFVDAPWVPFILYDFQKDVIRWLMANIFRTQGSIERANLCIEKSRDMGISWLICGFFLWFLLFLNGNFLIGSRKEEEVDKKGDLDTPFEKIRQMFYFLPPYLVPAKFNAREHDKERLFINPNGGQIVGEASCPDFGRGGRNLLVWMDEIQSWEYGNAAWKSCSQSTSCRLAVGTSDGMDNMLFELRDQQHGRVDVKSLIWRLHPTKAAGLYLDSNNKWTSPWYAECVETMSAEDVAAEIDIEYDKSARGVVFKTYVPDKHGQDLVEVQKRGEIIRSYDPGQKHFFVLWVQFDEFGRVLVLRELHMKEARLREVGRAVLEISKELQKSYPYYELHFDDVGDPQGATRTGAGVDHPDYVTLQEEFDIFVSYDFIQDIPTSMRESSRHTAIKNCLNDFVADAPGPRGQVRAGTMKFLVDKTHCPETHKALMSGYRFKTDKNGKALPGERIQESRPACDAIDTLGYAILRKWGVIDNGYSEKDFGIDDSNFKWGGQLGKRSA